MTNGEKIKQIFPSIELYEKSHDAIQINFDSVWWNAEYKEPTTNNDLADEYVSKADVLQILLDYDYANENALVLKDIKALPSVTPIRPKGHWIEVTNGRGGHECDVCHDYAPSFQNGNEYLSAFCPNCGADMREVEKC